MWDAGQEGELEGCRAGGIQDWTDAGQDGCRKGGRYRRERNVADLLENWKNKKLCQKRREQSWVQQARGRGRQHQQHQHQQQQQPSCLPGQGQDGTGKAAQMQV